MRARRISARLRYGVFQIDSQWILCSEQQHLGRFPDQLTAISAGKRAACHAMGSGVDAELFIMDAGGKLSRVAPVAFGH